METALALSLIAFGGVPDSGSISGRVWLDDNEDKIVQAEEQGLPDLQVELHRDGKVLHRTRTDAAGKYAFTSLPAGTYRIRVIAPVDKYFTNKEYDKWPTLVVGKKLEFTAIDFGLKKPITSPDLDIPFHAPRAGAERK